MSGQVMEMINQLSMIEILLVEDNPYDAEMVLHSLQHAHLSNRIHTVRDGEEALDFIFKRGPYAYLSKTEWPKVILLDLKLPKIDGIEVLRQIRNNPETKMMPVVALTSSKENRDIEECYKLGVNSYIVKPVDFAQFSEAVKNLGLYWLLLNQPPVMADRKNNSSGSP
jgi:two-component system, response regulator